MQTQDIVYGRTGQVVEFYAPESLQMLGVPSSVTYSVYEGGDSNDDTALFSGSATVDSVSATIGNGSYPAAAGVSQTNRNLIYLSATTGVVKGRLYLIQNLSGNAEIVEPVRVEANVGVQSLTDLKFDYPLTTATFKGLLCYFTVDATWVATESNILYASEPSYRVRWTYTVGGTVYNAQTYLRLVRKDFKTTLTPKDLVASWPELFHKEPLAQRGEQFQRLIVSAEEKVRADILAEGYRPEQISDTEILDRLVRLACFHEIAQFVASPTQIDREAFIDRTRRDYGDLLTRTLSNLKIPIDVGTEGATSYDPVQRYFFER